MMNVLKLDGGFFFFLRHPIIFFKEVGCALKWSWQRITKGYCDRDRWCIEDWFLGIMPSMLNEFAEKTYTTPILLEEEEWVNIVKNMARKFENCQGDKIDEMNEFSRPFMDNIRDEEIKKKFFDRQEELVQWRENELHEAFTLFETHLGSLWD